MPSVRKVLETAQRNIATKRKPKPKPNPPAIAPQPVFHPTPEGWVDMRKGGSGQWFRSGDTLVFDPKAGRRYKSGMLYGPILREVEPGTEVTARALVGRSGGTSRGRIGTVLYAEPVQASPVGYAPAGRYPGEDGISQYTMKHKAYRHFGVRLQAASDGEHTVEFTVLND